MGNLLVRGLFWTLWFMGRLVSMFILDYIRVYSSCLLFMLIIHPLESLESLLIRNRNKNLEYRTLSYATMTRTFTCP